MVVAGRSIWEISLKPKKAPTDKAFGLRLNILTLRRFNWKLLIALGCAMAYTLQSNAARIENGELLEYLMKKQEQSRAALGSFTLVTDQRMSTVSAEHGQMESVDEVHRMQFGDSVRLQVVGEFRRQQGGPTAPRHYAMAQNEAYVASWRQEDTNVITDLTIREHESLRQMSKNAAGVMISTLRVPDLLRFGFGLGSFELDEMYTLRDIVGQTGQDWVTWSVERSTTDDGEKYLVLLHDRRRSEGPVSVVTIDPNKGFLTTSFKFGSFRDDGSNELLHRWSIEAEEVAPGIWFPMALEGELKAHDRATSEQTVFSERVTSIEVNPSLSEDLFSWQALNYPGSRAFLEDSSGNTNVMRVRGGKLVPDSVYGNEARAALKKKKLLERLDLTSLIDAPGENSSFGSDAPLSQVTENLDPGSKSPAEPESPPKSNDGPPFFLLTISLLGAIALVAAFWVAMRGRGRHDHGG